MDPTYHNLSLLLAGCSANYYGNLPDPDEKAQALIGAIVTFIAKQVQPFLESNHDETGWKPIAGYQPSN